MEAIFSVGIYSDGVRAGDSTERIDTLRENPIEGFQPGWPLAESGYAVYTDSGF